MPKISDDVKRIIEFLENSSRDGLRKKDDLAAILEIGATFGESELTSSAIFYGAYLRKLNASARRRTEGDSGFSEILRETESAARILREILKKLIGEEFPETRRRFDKTYFNDGAGAFANLMDLASDLSELKKAQNALKRGGF